jgi:hypothetical protein
VTEHALVVDRKGLAKKLANRPKGFLIFELIQNSWDENVKEVLVEAKMLPGSPYCEIQVTDDAPEGFQNLESVYTLFRESKKTDDPEKRGRFELGEKLVAAVARRMEVCSTTGTVIIEGDGRRHTRKKTQSGSVITVEVRMTKAEFAEASFDVLRLIPPEGIVTKYNGAVLVGRKPLKTFKASLQTVVGDDEGNLVHAIRSTKVLIHETRPGEKASIYEMGIPVVETGDRWHYDVQQKVPVNWERNNVPPSYLKTLRVLALNAMHEQLTQDDAVTPWVTDALDDSRCEAPAVQAVVAHRFGDKAVIADPSDLEGTKIAVSEGYTVVAGGAFSKGAWDNIKAAKALLPAGQVTPSPKPYDPNGRPEKVIEREQWTPDMWRLAEFSENLFRKLTEEDCVVYIVNEPNVGWSANFGEMSLLGFRLCLNYGRLGKAWFALPKRSPKVLDLLIHEFTHHTVADHLSHEMHKTATRLGAKMVQIALDEPEFFHE